MSIEPNTTPGRPGPTDEILVRVLQGVASPDERLLVENWAVLSPANAEYLDQLSIVWRGLREGPTVSSPPDPRELIRRADSLPSHSPTHWRRVGGWIPAVAAALVALAIGLPRLSQNPSPSAPVLEAVEFATGPGERKTIELSDGSVVQLAPASRMSAVPVSGERRLEVEGRVFVAVAKHGPEWPFVIDGGPAEARVLGTRFEFSSEGGQVGVLVVDGLVSLSVGQVEALVHENEMATASEGSNVVVREASDIDAALGWMGQSLLFQETPLDRVAREIEVRYGKRVEIADAGLVAQTVSGGFQDRSFEEIARTVCRVIHARCSITEGGVIIEQR